MIVTFEEDYLSELYEKGKTTDKKYRFQPEIIKKYKYCINALKAASGIQAISRVKSFNYEELKGNKKGISSIRVNLQYRIEFTIKDNSIETVAEICNILELSNHYK